MIHPPSSELLQKKAERNYRTLKTIDSYQQLKSLENPLGSEDVQSIQQALPDKPEWREYPTRLIGTPYKVNDHPVGNLGLHWCSDKQNIFDDYCAVFSLDSTKYELCRLDEYTFIAKHKDCKPELNLVFSEQPFFKEHDGDFLSQQNDDTPDIDAIATLCDSARD